MKTKKSKLNCDEKIAKIKKEIDNLKGLVALFLGIFSLILTQVFFPEVFKNLFQGKVPLIEGVIYSLFTVGLCLAAVWVGLIIFEGIAVKSFSLYQRVFPFLWRISWYVEDNHLFMIDFDQTPHSVLSRGSSIKNFVLILGWHIIFFAISPFLLIPIPIASLVLVKKFKK